MSRKNRSIRRPLVLALGAVGLIALGAGAWQWISGLNVDEVDIRGQRHAALADLRALVEVDTSTAMVDVSPDSVSVSLRLHPWIEDVTVMRLPTGTLRIRLRERRPVALALDERGRPSHFFDAGGYMMPLTDDAVYDVPVVRGSVPHFRAGDPVGAPLSELLADLKHLPKEVTVLISDIELRNGEVWIQTLPASSGRALTVRLGKQEFADRLRRLHAFWHRAVIARPEKTFSLVDLRFNSQIVTRESQ